MRVFEVWKIAVHISIPKIKKQLSIREVETTLRESIISGGCERDFLYSPRLHTVEPSWPDPAPGVNFAINKTVFVAVRSVIDKRKKKKKILGEQNEEKSTEIIDLVCKSLDRKTP